MALRGTGIAAVIGQSGFPEGGAAMAEFKRIKVHATLVSGVMLLTDDQIDDKLAEVRDRLADSGLTVESVEVQELAATLPTLEIPVYDG